jgi:glyceraldehyde 3-phosphate dehydrogenase
MPVRIGINGFGRIGRCALKIALAKGAQVVAINDLGDNKTLAHLLSHDTNYGAYGKKVTYDENNLIVDGKKIRKFAEKEPANIPWKEVGADVVLECTGKYTDAAGAGLHLKGGAKRVLISAPPKGSDVGTYVLSVNGDKLKGDKKGVVSCASCTTNCIAPVMQVLHNKFGVKKAMMTTVHAYTGDQRLLDGTHKDLRRARAAAENIVPTSTGAAISTTEVIPDLKGKFDGLALRVPVSVVSLSDITALMDRKVTVEEINKAFEEAAASPQFKGILGVTKEPLVSSDFKGSEFSTVVDLPLTKVVDGDLVKVIAWYDNEWGYTCRLIEEAMMLG